VIIRRGKAYVPIQSVYVDMWVTVFNCRKRPVITSVIYDNYAVDFCRLACQRSKALTK
jgi:hypothetical protein